MVAGLEEELHPVRRGVLEGPDLHLEGRGGVEADVDEACCLWLVLGDIMLVKM